MPDETDTKKTLFGIDIMTALPITAGIAAPLTLALTGTLYLSGWIWRETVFEHFGISSGLIDEPFQVTLARGFLPLIFGSIALALALWAIWGMHRTSKTTFDEIVRKADVRPPSWQRMMALVYAINRFNILLLAALCTLSIGFVSGGAAGEFDALGKRRAVASGCKADCYRYSTGGSQFVGVLVAQDAKRTAIYSSAGLRIIRTDDLQSVTDYVPETKKASNLNSNTDANE